MGSIALGALVIAIVKIIRYILMYIESKLVSHIHMMMKISLLSAHIYLDSFRCLHGMRLSTSICFKNIFASPRSDAKERRMPVQGAASSAVSAASGVSRRSSSSSIRMLTPSSVGRFSFCRCFFSLRHVRSISRA